MAVIDILGQVIVFVPKGIRNMNGNELLRAIDDVELQRDDYGLCFDVESYELELRAENLRRSKLRAKKLRRQEDRLKMQET